MRTQQIISLIILFIILTIYNCENVGKGLEPETPEINGTWNLEPASVFWDGYLYPTLNSIDEDIDGYLILTDSAYEIDVHWIEEFTENDSIKKSSYERKEKGMIKKLNVNVKTVKEEHCGDYSGLCWIDKIVYFDGTYEFYPDSGDNKWSFDFKINQHLPDLLATTFPCIMNFALIDSGGYSYYFISSNEPIVDTIEEVLWRRQ